MFGLKHEGQELMSLFNTIWNASQQIRLESVNADMQGLKGEALQAARDEAALSQRVYVHRLEQLGLVCQAMWTLIQEKTNLTEADLLNRVTELDLRDGVLDGRYVKLPVECRKCGAKVARKFNRCLFCGQPSPEATAFDTV